MSLWTANAYGNISVTDEVVASIAGRVAMECYGVVELAPRRFSDALADLFKKNNYGSGVKIISKGDRVVIDLYVIFKFGMSIKAVAESLRSSVKYRVEYFTSMIVESVNIHVVGVRI